MLRSRLEKVLGSLTRVTTDRKYLAEVDGLRFVAIASVLLVHTGGIWKVNVGRQYEHARQQDGLMELVWLGSYGVELFFVISGFILALPFVNASIGSRPPVRLRDYYVRRLTRIEPPYLITMLLFFVASVAIGKYTFEELLPHLVASLGYLHNIVFGGGSLVNNVAWSLEVEVQFYLLFPLLARVFRWAPVPRRLVLVAIAVPGMFYELWASPSWPQTILGYGHYFVSGILICDVYARGSAPKGDGRIWDLLAMVGIGLFFYGNLVWPSLPVDFVNLVAFVMLFIAALYGKSVKQWLSWGWVPVFGGMCYSIYLLHARVLSLGLHLIFSRLPLTGFQFWDVCVLFLIMMPVCIAASAVFYVTIEQPCMRPDWPHRLLVKFNCLLIREKTVGSRDV